MQTRLISLYWCVIGFGLFSLILRAALNRPVWYFLPTDCAVLVAPIGFMLFAAAARRIDRHRYNHIVECHPLLARFVWDPHLGPKPVGSYRRRCFRPCCFFRAL